VNFTKILCDDTNSGTNAPHSCSGLVYMKDSDGDSAVAAYAEKYSHRITFLAEDDVALTRRNHNSIPYDKQHIATNGEQQVRPPPLQQREQLSDRRNVSHSATAPFGEGNGVAIASSAPTARAAAPADRESATATTAPSTASSTKHGIGETTSATRTKKSAKVEICSV